VKSQQAHSLENFTSGCGTPAVEFREISFLEARFPLKSLALT
jgi:hypothetical protein